ncbi:hypothetical protein C6W92_04180 [Roseovarius sp. A46]|jgi:hypothetical protein|uniref:hypothetical protein n=1 Tax=Roseovarius sp. A46 TaxID=2109331 RepID=UPI000E9CD79A|nr:hypothetical protein [Roseovarius sp. A46]RXV66371.1 hypothetical protein C6W92_04180 [Roseovarius sp. A46]HAW46254.1 hypothetical protein [Roseovarius sp.]
MKTFRIALVFPVVGLLAACDVGPDKTMDRNLIDKDHLSTMRAGIWIDPNGCDHWIIDDGVEGYLSQRLDKFGKPVCSGAAPPTVATGPFKEGQGISDSI